MPTRVSEHQLSFLLHLADRVSFQAPAQPGSRSTTRKQFSTTPRTSFSIPMKRPPRCAHGTHETLQGFISHRSATTARFDTSFTHRQIRHFSPAPMTSEHVSGSDEVQEINIKKFKAFVKLFIRIQNKYLNFISEIITKAYLLISLLKLLSLIKKKFYKIES